MTKYSRSVLITDLDDTLWSWLDIWHAAFSPMLAELGQLLDMHEDALIPIIKTIHERVGTSEYNYLIYDLEKELGGVACIEQVKQKYKSVLDIQQQARTDSMFPFPDALQALREIKTRGSKIIAYTESMAYSAMDKLKLFGLDGLIDVLYSREDYDLPEGLFLDQIRSRPHEDYTLKYTKHRTLPREAVKPDPETLKAIIQDVGAIKSECVYVGDKLLKDVRMAQDSEVLDVYAKYGDRKASEKYALLKRVTHWPSDAVIDEASSTEETTSPSIVLSDSFSELLSHIDFNAFSKRKTHE